MKYDNEKLNEVILVLWNDIKGELIPEHEKLTKFAYAINAWTNNQNENVDDCKFDLIELPFKYRGYTIERNKVYPYGDAEYIAYDEENTDGECMTASKISTLKMYIDSHLD